MQWEYKLVALGLLVDATEPHQRDKHEQILNDLGREEWEAVAYAAQSDTVLLKRPAKHAAERKTSDIAGRYYFFFCFTRLALKGPRMLSSTASCASRLIAG